MHDDFEDDGSVYSLMQRAEAALQPLTPPEPQAVPHTPIAADPVYSLHGGPAPPPPPLRHAKDDDRVDVLSMIRMVARQEVAAAIAQERVKMIEATGKALGEIHKELRRELTACEDRLREKCRELEAGMTQRSVVTAVDRLEGVAERIDRLCVAMHVEPQEHKTLNS